MPAYDPTDEEHAAVVDFTDEERRALADLARTCRHSGIRWRRGWLRSSRHRLTTDG
jgi:hypothetical protein